MLIVTIALIISARFIFTQQDLFPLFYGIILGEFIGYFIKTIVSKIKQRKIAKVLNTVKNCYPNEHSGTKQEL